MILHRLFVKLISSHIQNFGVDIKEYWHFDYGDASWALEKGGKYAIHGIIKE